MRKFLIILLLFISSFSTCFGQKNLPKIGYATFYSDKKNGHKTASGKLFNNQELTAASLMYPFGTQLKLTRIHGGQSVIVIITDRGPFSKNKKVIIDISQVAARKLNFISQGICLVKIEVLK